jgi:transposase InsO family protein
LQDGRPINVIQTDNGREFQNASIRNWAERYDIEQVFCGNVIIKSVWEWLKDLTEQ